MDFDELWFYHYPVSFDYQCIYKLPVSCIFVRLNILRASHSIFIAQDRSVNLCFIKVDILMNFLIEVCNLRFDPTNPWDICIFGIMLWYSAHITSIIAIKSFSYIWVFIKYFCFTSTYIVIFISFSNLNHIHAFLIKITVLWLINPLQMASHSTVILISAF
jgi:hypothetical protein